MIVRRPVLALLVMALFVSLLGNLLLGGVVLGHASRPLPSPAEIISLGPILKSLPEPDRRLMRHAFNEHRHDIQAATEAARRSAAQLQLALAATPVDPIALQTALDQYHHDFLALRGLVQDVFWQGAGQLSPEGRKRLADSAAFKKITIGSGG